jgi:catechol 2,3-dioxygenase-like lactoylglutathione lyase family enzyme
MIEPKGVVHFSIPVSDLEVSRKFYTEILGLKFKFHARGAGMVFLTAGEDHVILCKTDTKLQRSAAGVDIFEEEDRKSGVFVGRQFYIRDPDGTVIEFSEWDGTSVLE